MNAYSIVIFALVASALALDNGLGRTPQLGNHIFKPLQYHIIQGFIFLTFLGWNSWNHWHCNVNETIIRNTIDAMVSTGLRDAGYIYVNVDDCW